MRLIKSNNMNELIYENDDGTEVVLYPDFSIYDDYSVSEPIYWVFKQVDNKWIYDRSIGSFEFDEDDEDYYKNLIGKLNVTHKETKNGKHIELIDVRDDNWEAGDVLEKDGKLLFISCIDTNKTAPNTDANYKTITILDEYLNAYANTIMEVEVNIRELYTEHDFNKIGRIGVDYKINPIGNKND